MIGIRLADGSYYPVLDETQKDRKRMVLGPANDNQQEVHIQFFRDDSEAFISPEFLGSVDLQHLSPGSREDKNISIILAINEDDKLEVTAHDEDGGEERQLILQTQGSAAGANLFAGDEFSLDDEVQLPDPGEFIGDREDLEALHEESAARRGSLLDDGEYEWDNKETTDFAEPEREGLKPIVLAALVLVAASLTVGASFLIFRLMQSSDIPPIDGFVPGVIDSIRRIAALITQTGA